MRWALPHVLLYGLPLFVVLAAVVHFLQRRRQRQVLRLLSAETVADMLPGHIAGRSRLRFWLRTVALLLLLVAMARPQWGFRWEEIKRRGLDIMVVMDTSHSMLASDVQPNRLQQAKWGVHDLLRVLQGDRIGLVPFAGSALLQCPPTLDYAAFAMLLDDLYAGIIPRGGTAITKALQVAMDGFDEHSEADQVILLVTDGEDHEGNPLSLLAALQERGIRVYTIGIGTPEGELLPGSQAGSGFFKDRAGQVVKSTLREDILQRLALETGGMYVRSAPGDSGLERVFRESISHLKRQEQESRTAKVYDERYLVFLLAALVLLGVEALLPSVQGRRTS